MKKIYSFVDLPAVCIIHIVLQGLKRAGASDTRVEALNAPHAQGFPSGRKVTSFEAQGWRYFTGAVYRKVQPFLCYFLSSEMIYFGILCISVCVSCFKGSALRLRVRGILLALFLRLNFFRIFFFLFLLFFYVCNSVFSDASSMSFFIHIYCFFFQIMLCVVA